MRIVTGLALAGLLFLTLFTSDAAFLALVAVAVLAAQVEVYRALRVRGINASQTIGVASGAVVLVSAYQRGPSALAFAVSVSVIATLLWFLAGPEREGVHAAVGATLFGLLYPTAMAAHVVMMSRLEDGAVVTIAFFGSVAFYDIGAYAFGNMFGRRPMSPAISPKKTWEGAAGATLLVFVLAMAVGPHLGPFTLPTALGLAGIAVVLAPLGDLAESMLKRDLDMKDMGSLLPGHGGVMDRIDSLLVVAPPAYWLIRAFVV